MMNKYTLLLFSAHAWAGRWKCYQDTLEDYWDTLCPNEDNETMSVEEERLNTISYTVSTMNSSARFREVGSSFVGESLLISGIDAFVDSDQGFVREYRTDFGHLYLKSISKWVILFSTLSETTSKPQANHKQTSN